MLRDDERRPQLENYSVDLNLFLWGCVLQRNMTLSHDQLLECLSHSAHEISSTVSTTISWCEKRYAESGSMASIREERGGKLGAFKLLCSTIAKDEDALALFKHVCDHDMSALSILNRMVPTNPMT